MLNQNIKHKQVMCMDSCCAMCNMCFGVLKNVDSCVSLI